MYFWYKNISMFHTRANWWSQQIKIKRKLFQDMSCAFFAFCFSPIPFYTQTTLPEIDLLGKCPFSPYLYSSKSQCLWHNTNDMFNLCKCMASKILGGWVTLHSACDFQMCISAYYSTTDTLLELSYSVQHSQDKIPKATEVRLCTIVTWH